ncbi:MAG TPA: hypothetical protein VFZ78_01700 [Flavisolibacter sp.]
MKKEAITGIPDQERNPERISPHIRMASAKKMLIPSKICLSSRLVRLRCRVYGMLVLVSHKYKISEIPKKAYRPDLFIRRGIHSVAGASTEQPPDNNKYNNKSETTTTKFLGTKACDQCTKPVLHNLFRITLKTHAIPIPFFPRRGSGAGCPLAIAAGWEYAGLPVPMTCLPVRSSSPGRRRPGCPAFQWRFLLLPAGFP